MAMEERLHTTAMSQDGVFNSQDAARVGVNSDEITRMIRRREIVRVRRGAYVLSSVYAAAKPSTQHRLRVLAVLHSRPDGDRASHQSALVMHGLATYDVDERTIEIETPKTDRRRIRRSLATNPWSGGNTWSLGTHLCVSPARACVQVAASGFMAALCAMDSALNREKCTVDELRAAAATLSPIRRTVATRAIEAADDKCESPGETRTASSSSTQGSPWSASTRYDSAPDPPGGRTSSSMAA